MLSRWTSRIATAITMTMILAMGLATVVQAAQPGNDAFNGTWSRTDRPVLDGTTARTWMWGPEANTQIMSEAYDEAPGGQRQVQYFDKARMEITQPGGDAASIWYVTNGLLVVELITGEMQVGDNSFQQRRPADVNVAGDFDDPDGPTYATFGSLLDEAPASIGTTITERVDRQGNVSNDPTLSGQGVGISYIDNVTNHAIAAPFWSFMNSSGAVYENGQFVNRQLFEDPFFATGRPITEAYWANVKLGDQQRDVLVQCFERRCLTYTPGNPAGFIVEAGNVGQHYYEWRYGDDQDAGNNDSGDESGSDSPGDEPGNDQPGDAPGDDNPGDNPGDAPGNDSPGEEEVLVETATRYDFLTKFGLPREGIDVGDPDDVAAAPNGDIYVTDALNSRVLRFDARGIFITAWGSQGNGNGQFAKPRGIAVDSDGFVYVADANGHRIQKFDSNGAFQLSWGEEGSGDGQFSFPMGIAVDADDYVYVTDHRNDRVQKFNSNGRYLIEWGAEGTAIGEFNGPHGIDVSPSGLIYVADTGNDRVQIFDDAGAYQGSFGSDGSGDGQFDRPWGITVRGDGTAYVSDVGHERISYFTIPPVVAPASTSLQAVRYQFGGHIDGMFHDPTGVDLDPSGRLVVSNYSSSVIQIYSGSAVSLGGALELVDYWTDDSRGRFSPGQPRSNWIGHNGYVYATDGAAGQINVYSAQGQFLNQYGPILSNNLVAISLKNPADVTTDAAGFIYIADAGLDKIIKLDDRGKFVAQFGEEGTGLGQFAEPIAVAVDEDGNIYVADSANRRIQKFGPDFSFITAWDSEMSAAGQVDIPIDLAVGHGRVYVTFSAASARVEYFDLDGGFLGYFDGFTSIGGVAIDADASVFVGNGLGQIQKFSPAGELITSFGRLGDGDGEFTIFTAIRVAVDADGNVYATDSGGQRIQVFQPIS